MCERRRWDLYVRDMLQACERVTAYTAGMDQADFLSDRRTYDATLRNLELVGEAATRVPAAVRAHMRRYRGATSSGPGIGSFMAISASTTISFGASCTKAFPS